MKLHLNHHSGKYEYYSTAGYSNSDGTFNRNAVEGSASSSGSSYGQTSDSWWVLLPMYLIGSLLFATIGTGGEFFVLLCQLTYTWFEYHWVETVSLIVLSTLAMGRFWHRAGLSKGTPDMQCRSSRGKSTAIVLLAATMVVPLGLSVKTFFFTPPLELAVKKMKIKHSGKEFLFSPQDFQGSGEEGVQRLLQEISDPDAKLGLIVEGLLAIGPSGENALHTDGVMRLIQEISNPKANLRIIGEALQVIGVHPDILRAEVVTALSNRLRDDEKSHSEVLSFCQMFGEPLFPVLRTMASSKQPNREEVWEALKEMDVGTVGIDRFIPEVLENAVNVGFFWGYHFQGFLRKHRDVIGHGVETFIPTTKVEEEAKRTTLMLLWLFDRDDHGGLYTLLAEVRDRMHRIECGMSLPTEPNQRRY